MLLTRANGMLDTQVASKKSWAGALKVLLVVLLVLTGARVELNANVTVGNVLTLLLLPCWLPVLRRYRGAALFAGLTMLALINGAWITAIAEADHVINWFGFSFNVGLLVALLAGVGLILWSREHLQDTQVAMWFALGLLLGAAVNMDGFGDNPWKYGFAFGATVLLLAAAHWTGNRWIEILVALALAGVSAVTDSRSQFAILLFAAALVAWQMRPLGRSARPTAIRVLLGAVVAGTVLFNIVQALLLNGFMGETIRLRTQGQIETSGSLLLGGRPELGAFLALFADRPLGFGPGTEPDLRDVEIAKTGMEALGYPADNGYVENYMFDHRIELHSIIGDLWARFGLPGLALGALILAVVVIVLAKLLARSRASALMIYLVVLAVWNLAFGPLFSSLMALILAVGLALPAAPPASPKPAGPAT